MVSFPEFAPLNIPLRRRLQTCAVLTGLLALPASLAVMLVLLFHPAFTQYFSRELVIVYFLWTVFIDRDTAEQGGRSIEFFRRFPATKLVAEYFPARLLTPYLPPNGLPRNKPYVFSVHPHGVISISAIVNLILNANGAMDLLRIPYRCLTVSANFVVPFWREVMLSYGFVSANYSSAMWCLKHGISVLIIVGGALESLYARPGSTELTLARRKGFIRLALQAGADVIPVYSFGENELYSQFENPPGSKIRKLQDICIKVFGFTLPLIRGRGIFQYSFGILPQRMPLTTVVGKVIELPVIENPTADEVEYWHNIYVKALKEMYNKHYQEFTPAVDHRGVPIQKKKLKIVL